VAVGGGGGAVAVVVAAGVVAMMVAGVVVVTISMPINFHSCHELQPSLPLLQFDTSNF
jgi:hypothetical protein